MSHPGDAAEQVVNMAANVTLRGVEVIGNVAGKGLMSLAAFLIAAAKSQVRTRGKTRLQSFNGKPTKVFVIKRSELGRFAEEAKKYGVLYAAIVSKKDTDGLVDIVVNANDAAKVNRIADRFALSTVDVEKIREDILKSKQKRQETGTTKEAGPGPEAEKERTTPPGEKGHSLDDNALDEMLGGDAKRKDPNVQPKESANPTMAQAAKSQKSPSAPSSARSGITAADFKTQERDGGLERERPSVKKQVREIREERKARGAAEQPARVAQRSNAHRQPSRRKTPGKTKGR